jgi:DNA-directed RNA polymerase subunit RPC12/RpoP
MPKRSKARRTQSQAAEEFSRAAQELWTRFNVWHNEHPDATFDDMDDFLGEEGRDLMGKALELRLRQGDLGAKAEGQRCSRCGREMRFKGYPEKTVHGLKVDSDIPRAYYHCPACEAGLFPPGQASETEA